jgi:phosphohistidine phosphatase
VSAQLWLLRHGEAVPHGAKPDEERELTPRGERQAVTAGRALMKLGMEFDACYTSPKVRAVQTARLACAELGLEPEEARSLAEGFDRRDALDLFHAHGEDARILAVGHEPDFSQVIHDLTGGRVDLKKGGVAAVEIERGSGELIVLLRPRELETLAG